MMSDGPYKSLPMRRHWKCLAERAEKDAYSTAQVGEALPHALMKDFHGAPIAVVCSILRGPKQQALLFSDDRIESLESVRRECRGSAAANTLIDCAISTVGSGKVGEEACWSALGSALVIYADNVLRSVEEHYLREASSGGARFVRNRLHAARRQCDLTVLAAHLVVGDRKISSRGSLPRHTGIDEGPRL